MLLADDNIACDTEVIDITTGEQKQHSYTSFNPNQMVPVLEDGDMMLTESTAIMKYIADKTGSASYPRELRARARVDEMMSWFSTNIFHDIGHSFVYPQLFPIYRGRSDEAQAAMLERGRSNTQRWLALLNDHWLGPDKNHVCGNDVSLADYVGISQLTLGELVHSDYSPYGNVQRWLDTMKSRPNWDSVNAPFYGMIAAFKDMPLQPL
jgi:glutathione S-transferase